MVQILQVIVLLVLGNNLECLTLTIPAKNSHLNGLYQPSKFNTNNHFNSNVLIRKRTNQVNTQSHFISRRDEKEEARKREERKKEEDENRKKEEEKRQVEERKREERKREEDEKRKQEEENRQAEDNRRHEEELKRDEDRKSEEDRRRAEDRERDEDNKRREYFKKFEKFSRFVPKEITTVLPTPDLITADSADKRQNLLRKVILLTKLATVTGIDYQARKLKSDYNQDDVIQGLSFITEKIPRAGDILSGND